MTSGARVVRGAPARAVPRARARGRAAVAPVVIALGVALGATAWGAAARDALAWRAEQRAAVAELRGVETVRAQLDGSSDRLDRTAGDAIERLGDHALALRSGAFAAGGSIALGIAAGAAVGRRRRRHARVALHPSLAAAADRKLERLLAEHAQDLVTMLDPEGRFTYVSPSVRQILGYDPKRLLGERFDAVLDVATLEAAAGDRRVGEPVRHRARHASGEIRWLETLAHRIDGDRAVGAATLYSSRDVTERVHLEEALVTERRLLGDTLANIHAGILSISLDGTVIDANAEFHAMAGFRPTPGSPAVDVEARYRMLDADGADIDITDRPLLRGLLGETVRQLAATMIGADGRRREVMATAGPLVGADGRRNGAVLTVHDVSELRAAEAELRSLATVDVLTGLPNRRHLHAALTDAMARNAETPERVALLFLDLDGFKLVNDTYGHDVGDQVLRMVASRIVACLRGHDMVGRIGGDEFVVVVEHLHVPSDVLPLVARIEAALSTPFEVEVGVPGVRVSSDGPEVTGAVSAGSRAIIRISIGVSVGVALGRDVADADELMARADAAMYERKRARTGRGADLARPVASAVGPVASVASVASVAPPGGASGEPFVSGPG